MLIYKTAPNIKIQQTFVCQYKNFTIHLYSWEVVEKSKGFFFVENEFHNFHFSSPLIVLYMNLEF